MHRAGHPRSAALIAFAIVAAATAVRLYHVGAQSFDALEITYIGAADRLPASIAAERGWPQISSDLPLPGAVVRLALRHGFDECTLRFSSVLAGALTVLALWRLGVMLFGGEAALFA